jgi:hypothetical protein
VGLGCSDEELDPVSYVRTIEEREFYRKLKLARYFTRRDYKQKEPLLFAMLDTWAPFTTDQAGTRNGRALAEMLSCVLERDRTFFSAIRKGRFNSEALDRRDGWTLATRSVAGAIVERYERGDPPATDELMLSVDELRGRLQTALEGLATEVTRLEAAGLEVNSASNAEIPAELAAQADSDLLERLMHLLQDDVVFLSDPEEDGLVPRDERDREISKRALMRLRLKELRDIAEDAGLDAHGLAEEIADRVAGYVNDDDQRIAELILGDAEVEPDDGLTTALYRLEALPKLADAHERLLQLKGKYARIGVAKWFLCDDVLANGDALTIAGRLRLYRVAAKLDYDGYDLAATPREGGVRITLSAGSPWLEINIDNLGDVDGLSTLMARVAGVKLERPFIFATDGLPDGVTPRSTTALALLVEDFQSQNFELLNLVAARFETPSATNLAADEPAIRNVRFGGQHLLEHAQSCELLIAGRDLTRATARIRVTLNAQNRLIRTAVLELRDDYAVLATAMPSTDEAGETRAVHRAAVEAIKRGLSRTTVPSSAIDEIEAMRTLVAEDRSS